MFSFDARGQKSLIPTNQGTEKAAGSTARLVLQDTSAVLHERIPILPVLTFVVLYIFCGAGRWRTITRMNELAVVPHLHLTLHHFFPEIETDSVL